ALERFAGDYDRADIVLHDAPDHERAVRVLKLVHQLTEGDAVEGQPFGVRLYPDLIGAASNDVGQPDILDLHQLMLQFLSDLAKTIVRPAIGGFRPGRQSEGNDGDIVDTATDDKRFRDAEGQLGNIGPYLLVYAQQRRVLIGAD